MTAFRNLKIIAETEEKNQKIKKGLAMLFSLEWYLNQIQIIVANKMGLRDAECYSPYELDEFIRGNDSIYDKMSQFKAEYIEWYNYHRRIEKKEIQCDASFLKSLSDKFKQTRESLLVLANELGKNRSQRVLPSIL